MTLGLITSLQAAVIQGVEHKITVSMWIYTHVYMYLYQGMCVHDL